MKAIRTYYRGPTNTRGSRIVATDEDGNRKVVPYNYSLNADDRHGDACRALCEKMGWHGTLRGGYLGNDMVWVWVNDDYLQAPKLVIKRPRAEKGASHVEQGRRSGSSR